MHPAAGFAYKDVYRQVEETTDPRRRGDGSENSRLPREPISRKPHDTNAALS